MNKMHLSLSFLCLLGCCLAAPIDEPVHVDLPVYNQPAFGVTGYDQPRAAADAYDQQAGSDVKLNAPLEPENYSDYSTAKSGGTKNSLFAHSENSIAGGIFAAPVTSRENVLLETEAFPSKILSVKDNLHNTVAGFFQPKPLLDTIEEEEKYGNSGDKFYNVGRALVGGASKVSNVVNTLLETPGNILRQFTKSASEKLNNLGGKLIGL